MTVEIRGLGFFEPQYLDDDEELICFQKPITFQGQNVDLIVYPNDDGSDPDDDMQIKLWQMFDCFANNFQNAFIRMLPKIRQLASEYQLEVERVTDEQMISDIRWQNIKLQPDGSIECYLSISLVADWLDIVVGFIDDLEIKYVHFDG